MCRFLFLLLPLCLLLPVLAAPRPAATLLLGSFPQRMADRYTSRDGLPAGRIVEVEVSGSEVRVYSESGAARLDGSRWRPFLAERAPRFPFVRQERPPVGATLLDAAREPARGGRPERVWVVTDRGVFRSEGDGYVPFPFPDSYLTNQRQVNIDAEIRSVMVDSNGTVWLGGSTGLFATDGGSYWNVIDRQDGLPYEDVTCMAAGADGELWAGTGEGVCRYTRGEWQYYWGPRWLPDNRVNDIAVDSEGAAWVATDGGAARLYDRSMTLARKAAHYQQLTDVRHNRRGYVTGSRLRKPGDPSGGVIYHASDNDGLWTAIYVGAQSFRYAATKDPAARTAARKSMRAMLDLVRYTGIPGFPARAILTRGELERDEADGYDPNETVRIAGETDKIWFPSPVDPQILCKGDTSSDELDGHYFAWSVYYDLVADDADRKAIRETVAAVTDNLLRNDLTLVGHTGRKTRWGVYHPRYINDDPTWWEERGLNALSILSYLKIAEQICGDPRYTAKYRELIEQHHYLLNTVTQKVAEPWWDVNHSDDEMAFMMYYTLMGREKDPATRRVLLQSIERSWKIERPEASPFFNFIYGASAGAPCDLEASVAALQSWPWELIDWQARGSHRHDVEVLVRRGEGRARSQLNRALPPAERRVMRWNGNPYQADGGSPDGAAEEDGSAWLLPYWMGRYHGFIEEREER